MKNPIIPISENYMEEGVFWKLVEKAEWAKSTDYTKDYTKIKIMYLKTLTEKGASSFRNTANELYRTMVNFIHDKTEQGELDLNIGDDSFSDLIFHIIGLGEKEYYGCLGNCKMIQDRAEKKDYQESFGYCIPYTSDYNPKNSEFNISSVIQCAKAAIKEASRFDSFAGDYLKPIEKELKEIKEIANEFLQNTTEEGIKELSRNKDKLHNYSKKISKFFEDNKMELPRKFTDNGANGMYVAVFSNMGFYAQKVREFMTYKPQEPKQ